MIVIVIVIVIIIVDVIVIIMVIYDFLTSLLNGTDLGVTITSLHWLSFRELCETLETKFIGSTWISLLYLFLLKNTFSITLQMPTVTLLSQWTFSNPIHFQTFTQLMIIQSLKASLITFISSMPSIQPTLTL